MKTDTITAYVLLLLAFLACSATVYFQSIINDAENNYQIDLQTAQQFAAAQSSSVSTHAVVQDTVQDRAQLDAILSPDVVSIATMLRGVGQTTGVTVMLGGALPETADPTQNNSGIQAIAFSLGADGSFAALMRTEALIETLPLPSSIERFDIQRGTSTNGLWHMDISIRVLVAATPSS